MTFTADDATELNRLIGRGLNNLTAMAVIDGKLDEEFEVAQAEIERKAQQWGIGLKNIPENLVPGWDCDPSRIYLAYDGDHPDHHSARDFALIEADIADVHLKLTYQATRDEDPWHRRYKSKSIEIGYRWVHGLRVSPPVTTRHEREIVIVGGMHRYHLAHHYGAERMPFYVPKSELAKILELLPHATLRWRGDVLARPFIGRLVWGTGGTQSGPA